jgi:hypothetical protein
MVQQAPYPAALQALVDALVYRPGWRFRLVPYLDRGQDSRGTTLVITTSGYDACHVDRGEGYRVSHYMLVPPAAYNEASWRTWLFEQILLVEKHEAMEFFAFMSEDKLTRPYQPNHGFGWDPYLLTEVTTEIDRRTSFRNELVPEA